jgi:uncharacterized SAM-binding protein YcdF (DUF218 family)
LRRRRVLYVPAFTLIVIVLLTLTHAVWLGWLGDILVADMAPAKADADLVLAGDIRGSRICRAGDLVRTGHVPKVLVSGPMDLYGVNEADLAIQFAVANGYPREWFEPVRIKALSTEEEARAIGAALQQRGGIRRLLIVTNDYHTARSRRIFRRSMPAIEILTIGAPDKYFQPRGWWHTREGWKIWFYETTKTLAGMIGI